MKRQHSQQIENPVDSFYVNYLYLFPLHGIVD